MSRINVLLLFGGRSSEHSISCTSAGNVLRAIDRSRYDVIPVGIDREGRWWRQPDDPDAMRIVDGALPSVRPSDAEVLPSASPGGSFMEQVADRWRPLPHIDVVFPILHGPWGEDGTIQGLLETAGVPYVGSGVLASAAGMDKGYTKIILAAAGLSVGRWVAFHARDWQRDAAAIASRIDALQYPVFVKPCRAGSSVGVSKVHGRDGLEAAISTALQEDPRVIVEAGSTTPARLSAASSLTPTAPRR